MNAAEVIREALVDESSLSFTPGSGETFEAVAGRVVEALNRNGYVVARATPRTIEPGDADHPGEQLRRAQGVPVRDSALFDAPPPGGDLFPGPETR
jgi:hypothetical protein